MKKEYVPWICLYLAFAGFFFLAVQAPAGIATGAKQAIVGITWCRVITFIYFGFVMEMSWYQPRTVIFNAARGGAELMILVGLWSMNRPIEVVVSILALSLYELSRQRVKYN